MKNPILKFTVLFISLFVVINNWLFAPGNILSWDVFGYYLYLPLKFIYNDLGMVNDQVIFSIIEKYKSTSTFYQGMRFEDGHYVMKYSMGLSFFYAPFFFIGHLIAKTFGYPVDGFSAPYQYAIFIGCIIYTLIGIYFLAKVLKYFFSDKIASLLLLLTVFATNFILHTTMYGQNSYSHNILFSTYAIIIWLTIQWHKTYQWKHIIPLAIICGLTILSRPSEIVCLIIPAIWGIHNKTSLLEKLQILLKYKMQILSFGLLLIMIGSFQFIYWKLYAGKFLYNSYGGNAGEGFEFLSPYILKVLFSFRKGWFIYTPIMLLATAGFYFLYKSNRSIFYTLLIYFICTVYFISSWSCWWYAQSYSQRPVIPMYPVMAILLGYLLTAVAEKKNSVKLSFSILIILLLGLNLFQTVQHHKGIIHADRMTKAYYFKTFGKMKTEPEDEKLLMVNRSYDGTMQFKNPEDYTSRILQVYDFEAVVKHDTAFAKSGKYALKLDSTTIYSDNTEAAYSQLTTQDHAWIKVSAWIYPTDSIQKIPFTLACHFNHKGYPYHFMSIDFEKTNTIIPNTWNKVTFDYLTPEVRNASDNIKIFFWNRGKLPVYIDDMKVEVFEKKNEM